MAKERKKVPKTSQMVPLTDHFGYSARTARPQVGNTLIFPSLASLRRAMSHPSFASAYDYFGLPSEFSNLSLDEEFIDEDDYILFRNGMIETVVEAPLRPLVRALMDVREGLPPEKHIFTYIGNCHLYNRPEQPDHGCPLGVGWFVEGEEQNYFTSLNNGRTYKVKKPYRKFFGALFYDEIDPTPCDDKPASEGGAPFSIWRDLPPDEQKKIMPKKWKPDGPG